MNSKLFTSNFIKICLSNLLLFIALYLVLPIVPFALSSEINILPSWGLLLFFIIGMLIGGPFHNYYIESCNRKKMCRTSILGVVLPNLIYIFLSNYPFLFIVAILLQGYAFGMATAVSITIAIDVTDPQRRNKGNTVYAWAGRIGMFLAIPLGLYLYDRYGFNTNCYVAIAVGILSILFVITTKTPFRAPIGAERFSLDRFILPGGWKLVSMMILLAFIIGSIFPLFFHEVQTSDKYFSEGRTISFIILPFVVFLLSALLARVEIDALYHQKALGFILARLPILLIAAYFYFRYDVYLSTLNKQLLVLLALGFVLAIIRGLFHKRIVQKINKWQLTPDIRMEVASPILSGIICILLALSLHRETLRIDEFTAYLVIVQLLFFGIARVSSPILMLLIVSSRHCERSTANTSHILAWEVGLALGCAYSLMKNLSEAEVLKNSFILIGVILALYALVYIDFRRKIKRHIKQISK